MTPLVFFGSDRYSAIVLRQLLTTNYQILMVVTDPYPGGSPVENLANVHNLKLAYYPSNSDEMNKFITNLKSTQSITGLSASFPHLFPPSIINLFAGQLYNLHPSLLPQYRNVAPVPYAIAMGDTETGVSIFPVAIGIDNGQLVAQQKESIRVEDTTPSLLPRLFTLGAQLFLDYLRDPKNPSLTSGIPIWSSSQLIFTRKLTRESGFVEWTTVKKLLENKAIAKEDTTNPLLTLRLTHHPDRTQNMLSDLIRALDGYEKVWSIVPTRKGDLQVCISYQPPPTNYQILISGKPKPISYTDFAKHYLK